MSRNGNSFVVWVTNVGCFRPVVRYHPDPDVLRRMRKSHLMNQPGVQALTLFDPNDLVGGCNGALVQITTVGGELKTSSTIDRVLGAAE